MPFHPVNHFISFLFILSSLRASLSGFSEAGGEESIGSSFLYSSLPPPTPLPPSIPSSRSPHSPAPPLASSSGRDVEADDRDANAAGEPPKKRRRRAGVSWNASG
ncbi:hypothetical protein C8J57DRAFT_1495259 [Mycena rebaudengoi]|nr:hypothetical protein C8J57DRAFT_1495259 [Mycena rebaudengoi]